MLTIKPSRLGIYSFCLLGFNVALTSQVISWLCLLVAVVPWPMCCHTEIPWPRHRTWHPNPSQYTDTGPTCRCAICWCWTSCWNAQLFILMSWVPPDWEFLPDLPHTLEYAQLYDAGMVVVSQKLSRKCTVLPESWTWYLWCANPLRYPLAHSCFSVLIYEKLLLFFFNNQTTSNQHQQIRIQPHVPNVQDGDACAALQPV